MAIRELLQFGHPTQVPVRLGLNPVHSLQDEVNRLFNGFFSERAPSLWNVSGMETAGVIPSMDVSENDKAYTITAELPGIDMKDIEITVAEGYITVKGEKKAENKEEKEGYFRQERSYGSFQRTVSLPDKANTEAAEASLKNGVLTISVPKEVSAESKPRKLNIKSAA